MFLYHYRLLVHPVYRQHMLSVVIEKHMLSVNWMDQQSVVIEKHMLSVNWMDEQSVVIEQTAAWKFTLCKCFCKASVVGGSL
jgi:hypothetical protein